MKHINTFHLFESKQSTLYRTTMYEWILNLLEKGESIPKKGTKYLSFSKDPNSGDGDNNTFGNITLDLNYQEIFKQNAIEIIYTEEFFNKNPVCFYVTGFHNNKDYEEYINRTPDFKRMSKQEAEYQKSIINTTKEKTWKELIKGF